MYAKMIAEQRERMRKQRVLQQCTSLLNSIDLQLKEVAEDIRYSSFVGNTDSTRMQMKAARELSLSDPDKGLLMAQEASRSASDILSIAYSGHKQWSDNRRMVYRQTAETVNEIKAIPIESKKLQLEMAALVSRLDANLDVAAKPEYLKQYVEEIKVAAIAVKERDEREVIRREVVKKVVGILEDQGFSVDSPKIKDNVVFITSTTPTGKAAMFQIQEDNMMKFDFEGYEGTTCKEQLDVILEKLGSDEDIKTGIEQFVWKNPDRIKKGAKDLPYGTQRHMAGRQ
ncbi:hypothetical protein [Methanocella sp. MCL-LM]|uniref:hypothetical protein n=1 Tax=Methanocella sp. MCL-LM TaxID=3412035 RepID=UPI003C76CF89